MTEKPRWSQWYTECRRCSRDNVAHHARGLCRTCYRMSYEKKTGYRRPSRAKRVDS